MNIFLDTFFLIFHRNWNTIFKQELYRRSRLESRIIKLFIPSLEKDDMFKIEKANEALRGHIIDIPEDLSELRSNITELGRFISGEQSRFNNGEFDDEEEDLDCLKDDDYIFNSLDFTPKFCILFTTCSSDPRLSSNGNNLQKIFSKIFVFSIFLVF